MEKMWNRKRSFFIPSYNELSLALMSFTFLVVFFTNKELMMLLFNFMRIGAEDAGDLIVYVMLLLVFTAGLVLSLYHIFTEREKSVVEKYIMLIFAIVSNAVGGILASAHILKTAKEPSIFLLFPVWNIINCLILLMLFRLGKIDERSISDENALPIEVIPGFIIVAGVFVVCQYVFKFYWAVTFSICVVYATSFSKAIGAVFNPRMSEARLNSGTVKRVIERAAGGGKSEKCGLCGRVIRGFETPWVVGGRTVVCKECYDRIQREKDKENEN